MLAIENKVVAITGASSGIGEAAAIVLARHGARLLLGARRGDRLSMLVERIRDAGGQAEYRVLDVTRRESMAEFVQHAVNRHGRLDVLVGNAGVMPLSPMAAARVEEWERMIDVNVKGVLYGIAAALPVMQAQGGGQFIHVSSVAGRKVFPTGAVYCGSKFAVHAISEGLREEVGDRIRVCTIAPGGTESELAESIAIPEVRQHLDAAFPERLPAEAIARAIAFAIGQPDGVDVNEIVVRPTSQGF